MRREEIFSLLPVVLSLLESGIMSPRDRDLSIRICRSSCGLEFGSCRPFSRSFAGFAGNGRLLGVFSGTGRLIGAFSGIGRLLGVFSGTDRLLGIFSLFGCAGIIVILLCLRGCASAAGGAGSAGFGTLCFKSRKEPLSYHSINNNVNWFLACPIYIFLLLYFS